MLRWLQAYLPKEAGLKAGDAAVLWAAIATAFFFMFRASEYLFREDRTWSAERVIRGEDVVARKDNRELKTLAKAEEIVIYIRG